MIGLGLIVIAGLYIAFLVFAWKTPRTRRWKIIAIVLALSPVIWKTWDIPVGYYLFKQACEAEAGVKIFDPSPASAERIRLEGSGFGGSYAVDVLKRYPSLRQVEATDKQYSYLTPPAYALYERQPDGTTVSILMDTVGKLNDQGETKVLDAGFSNAIYAIRESMEYLPYRLHRRQHVLSHADGRLVASVTYYGYTDTDPDKSLFGATWGHGESCGPGRGEIDTLLSLIASKR